MKKLQYIASLVLVTLSFGIETVAAQTDDLNQAEISTITVGISLEKVHSVLEQNGCNNPYGLAWAKPAPDKSFCAFQIDDGVVLVLTFSDSTKSVLAIQMMFTPLVPAKANNRIIGLRRILFEPDGTYLLHMLKQNKRGPVPTASPTPQIPKSTAPK